MKRILPLLLLFSPLALAQNTVLTVKVLPEPTIPAKPTVTLQMNPPVLYAGQPMTVTATVEGVPGYPAPTGQIEFLLNGQVVQTSTLIDGGITCEATAPPAGTYKVGWIYLGDKYYQKVKSQ